jgi:putative FmdB family regulatory protein
MPFYEFQCQKCNHKYDELCSYDETGKYPDVKCPECGSKKKDKLISNCSFQFAQPEGTDRWNSDSTGHDYRFKHNFPKVMKEREKAQQASHMGANPYGDTSEADIQLDTGIHDADSRSGLS